MGRLTTISLLLCAQSSVAAVWFVDKDNIGGEDGMSWATAFTTIQPAIDAAFDDGGGEIWVAEGTYDELRVSMLHSPAVDTGSLVLRDDVQLFGGFVGTETMRDQRDFENNVTIIDGSTSRSGSPAFHVVFGAANSGLDGFTVTGGQGGSGNPLQIRSGAGLRNNSNDLTLRNCSIIDNIAADGSGGGVFTSMLINVESCTFSNNSALDGGAFRGTETSSFTDCIFNNNHASSSGGAILNAGTVNSCIFISNTASAGGAIGVVVDNAVFESCTFQNNVADSPGASGGAVRVGGFTEGTTFINCVFNTNSAADSNGRGGAISASGIIGMDNTSSTNVDIVNCTFWGNTAGSGGGAVHYESVDGFIRNSIFWNNSPNQIAHLNPGATLIMFNDVQGGQMIFGGIPLDLDEGGNIDAEPFFVDPENGDFRVFTGSPVIDAGTAAGAPATDIAGIPRPQGAGFDMGAHESDGSLPSIPAAQTAALIMLAGLLAAVSSYALWRHRAA